MALESVLNHEDEKYIYIYFFNLTRYKVGFHWPTGYAWKQRNLNLNPVFRIENHV